MSQARGEAIYRNMAKATSQAHQRQIWNTSKVSSWWQERGRLKDKQAEVSGRRKAQSWKLHVQTSVQQMREIRKKKLEEKGEKQQINLNAIGIVFSLILGSVLWVMFRAEATRWGRERHKKSFEKL